MADWTELPRDLLESILKRLTILGDLARFRSVCKAWRSVHNFLFESSGHQLPGLFLPTNGTFYSLLNNPLSLNLLNNPLSLCQIPEGHVIGGAFGSWLVVIDRRLDIFLLNPFLSHKIQLPSLTTLPNIMDARETKTGTIQHTWISMHNLDKKLRQGIVNSCHRTTGDDLHESYMVKVVLSGDPVSSRNFVSIGITGETGHVAFCKSASDKWTLLQGDWSLDDIIYYQDKFYGITHWCELVVLDLGTPSLVTKHVLTFPTFYDILYFKKYLVDCAGELLLVSRLTSYDDDIECAEVGQPNKTFGFKIFKLDLSGSSWYQVKTIGDQALFLGLNTSLSLSAPQFDGCKPNHIYFMDDDHERSYQEPWGGHDTGIFNIEDETIEPFHLSDSRRIWPPPIWLAPKPWQTRYT